MINPHTQQRTLEERYLAQITAILIDVLKDTSCTIYLFGSRATGAHTTVSDFDIAILATQDISRELSVVREMLDMSNIPFKVDLVDLRSTSAAWGSRVQAEGILLWKN